MGGELREFQEYGFDSVVDDTKISHDEDNTQVTQRATDIQFLQAAMNDKASHDYEMAKG